MACEERADSISQSACRVRTSPKESAVSSFSFQRYLCRPELGQRQQRNELETFVYDSKPKSLCNIALRAIWLCLFQRCLAIAGSQSFTIWNPVVAWTWKENNIRCLATI
eukprot:658278-Amphidinium_carterae.1